ncbi:hypothetical protein ACFLRF_01395 [Candidatus Altiarchaeota archaeon]
MRISRIIKGQSSIEYLTIISFIMLFLAGVLSYIYKDIAENSRFAIASSTMSDIRSAVDRVYAAGPGRKETITIMVPSRVLDTDVGDNRINMIMDTAEGPQSEVLEVVDSGKVTGYVPVVEGVYELPIEYKSNGVVYLGNGLLIVPDDIDLNLTSDNSTTFVCNVTNIGDKDIEDINATVAGLTASWFWVNDTDFDLPVGGVRPVLVNVTTPSGMLPVTFTNHCQASNPKNFAENNVNVRISGDICGDAVKAGTEECDAEIPFQFPVEDSMLCPNPADICNESGNRLLTYDSFGFCDSSCNCGNDTAIEVICGTGCNNGPYCYSCDHCNDGVRNCQETTVDEGGYCSDPGGPWIPLEPMEDINCTITYQGTCSGPIAEIDNSTQAIEGSYSGNITFVKTVPASCIPTWNFFIDPPVDLSSYNETGIIAFKTYRITPPQSQPHKFYFRIGNDNETYWQYDGLDTFSILGPVGTWKTNYIYIISYNPASSSGTMDWNVPITYFAIEGDNTGAAGTTNFLIDDIKVGSA